MFPPKGILENDPESAGDATIRAFPKPVSDLNLFMVGPKTARVANPVPKARVPIQSAVFDSPLILAICSL